MSAVKSRQIAPLHVQVGMQIRAVQTYPNGLVVTAEGRAHSIGNGTSIRIGNVDGFVEIPVQHTTASTSWHELIVLPEKPMAVALVKQPTGDILPVIRQSDDVWPAGSHRTHWTDAEVLAQLECVLWEGQEP